MAKYLKQVPFHFLSLKPFISLHIFFSFFHTQCFTSHTHTLFFPIMAPFPMHFSQLSRAEAKGTFWKEACTLKSTFTPTFPVRSPVQCIFWFPDQSRHPCWCQWGPLWLRQGEAILLQAATLGPSGHHKLCSSMMLLCQDAQNFFAKDTLVFWGKPIAQLARWAPLPRKKGISFTERVDWVLPGILDLQPSGLT